MSKELETLEPSVVLKFVDGLLKRYEGKTDYNIYITKEWLLEIKQALKRLEALDNANPSEALECLEFICKILNEKRIDVKWLFKKDYNTIKQALLKAQEPKQYVDELKLVEKKLKALEIIKEKNVDVFRFKKLDFNTFNQLQKSCKLSELTQEEFNLLKEVLK